MPRRITVAAISCGIEASFASRSLKVEENVARAMSCIDRIAPCKPDLIALPEAFHAAGVPGRYDELGIKADHEIVRRIAGAAAKLNTHIVCPIYEKRGELTFNTALWIDRKGHIAGRYDKIHPTEGEIDSGVTCGLTAPTVWTMDLGKVAARTCFDINWPSDWSELRRAGVELIVWVSAYGGGRPLAAHAMLNQYFILTATWPRLCRVYDPSGEVITECGRLGDFIVSTIDLDRRLFHWDYQGQHIDAIRAKYGRDVQIDIYHEEGWFALASLRDGLGVTDLIKEFGLVPLHEYFARATTKQNHHRPTHPQ